MSPVILNIFEIDAHELLAKFEKYIENLKDFSEISVLS